VARPGRAFASISAIRPSHRRRWRRGSALADIRARTLSHCGGRDARLFRRDRGGLGEAAFAIVAICLGVLFLIGTALIVGLFNILSTLGPELRG
jgi:hypothetical protein